MGYVSLWYFSCNAYILGTMFSCYLNEIHFLLWLGCFLLLSPLLLVRCPGLLCAGWQTSKGSSQREIQQFLVSERQVRAWKGPEARCSPVAKGGLKEKIGLQVVFLQEVGK